jgi:sterol 14alpha-demethylase
MKSRPPLVSGGRGPLGHTMEFLRSPETLMERGYREHGEVFGLRVAGKPFAVLVGAERAKFLFSETDRRLSIRLAYPFFRHMFSAESYFLAEHEEYKRQREIVLPRFQSRNLAAYVDVMDRGMLELVDDLGREGTIDLVGSFGPRILGIAAECFLGPEFARRMDGFFEVFKRFSEGLDPLLPSWVPAPHMVRSHRARDLIRSTVGAIIRERQQQPLDPPDFLQSLAEARYADGQPVPEPVLVSLALMLTWTAWETTTGQLCWGLIDLLQNPGELSRVRAEQSAVLDGRAPLDTKTINRLAHLDRAMHETERLHPATNGIVRVATEDIEYDGYHIPKKAFVLVPPRMSHRMPDLFPEPDRYRPDRFGENPKLTASLVGFGGGLHRCIGAQFAYLEMKVATTRMFQLLDMELVDADPQPVPGQKTKWPQVPCRVRYRVRQPAALPVPRSGHEVSRQV